MAQIDKYQQLTIETIKEMLVALDYCFEFDKSSSKRWQPNEPGMLGMPALVLLSSVIDTMGSYFRNTEMHFPIDSKNYKIDKAAEHFFVLNHPELFNFSWTMTAIMDFYRNFRSVATHNGTLPTNSNIDIGCASGTLVELNDSGSIKILYLRPLFEAVDKASETFFRYVEANWSDDHKLSKEIEEKQKTEVNTHISITLTGKTHL